MGPDSIREDPGWQGQLGRVIESIADGVLIVNRSGRFDFANAAAERILGTDRSQIIGRRFDDPGWTRLSAEGDPFPHDRIPYAQVLNTGEAVRDQEFSVERADGTRIVVRVSASPLRNESGELIGIVAVFSDVTERDRVERALRDSEERYRSLVEASPDAIAVYAEGKFVFVNSAAVLLLGARSEDELLGRSVLDFIHPQSLELVKGRMAQIARERKPLPAIEERLLRIDGTPIWVELAAIPFMFKGQPSVQVIVRDITERKTAQQALQESEARYRLLFESNPQPLWVYDLETLRFLAVNEAAIQHYGYSREEFLSMTIADIRPAEDVPRLLENVRAVTSGLDVAGIWRHTKKDGTVIDVAVTSYVLEFAGRRAELVLANDVTELTRAQKELKEKDLAIRRAYVDVLSAVTGNRLVLMTPEEINAALGQAIGYPVTITTFRELAAARTLITRAIREHMPHIESINEFIVAVCEALTNAVKHGGKGTYQVLRRGKTAQVAVSDEGPGIDFRHLPKATLVSGFSTQATLGVGFTLMLDLSDRVLLSTQPGGTTVVLEVSR